jgi:putative FmdB family regulatory protein
MPQYEYVCKECNKTFSLIMTLAEYDKGIAACPECKSKKVEQKVAPFFAVTSKKS